jgi:hypothetical protein
LIKTAKDNIAEIYDLHHFESTTEHLKFLVSLLADNKEPFPVAEGVGGGVRGPNPTRREFKAANKCPASTSPPNGSNPAVYQGLILSSGKQPG